MENLSTALKEAQSKCIGLFKYRDVEPWLVIEKDDDLLTCIQIGSLLGLQELHINKSQGQLHMFPNKQTLAEFQNNVIDFMFWYRTKIENKKY